MSDKDDGGPAFPKATATIGGMTLRDYFAAKAMQGMCVGMITEDIKMRAEGVLGGKMISQAAYVMADAMLDARSK